MKNAAFPIAAFCIALFAQAIFADDDTPGKALLQAKCGVCHTTDQAFALTKEPEAWRRTVERMAAKRPGRMTARDERTIAAFLLACCAPPPDRLFEARCGTCHELPALRRLSLSSYERAYLADACRSRNPARIGVDELRRITAYLDGDPNPSGEGGSGGLLRGPRADSEKFLFSCGTCHASHKLTRVRSGDEWKKILDRMVEKSPRITQGTPGQFG